MGVLEFKIGNITKNHGSASKESFAKFIDEISDSDSNLELDENHVDDSNNGDCNEKDESKPSESLSGVTDKDSEHVS